MTPIVTTVIWCLLYINLSLYLGFIALRSGNVAIILRSLIKFSMKYWALFLLAGCTGMFVAIPEETGSINAYFCDQINCLDVLRNLSNGGLQCAMYHPSKEFLELSPNVLIVDEEHPVKNAVVEKGSGLMHNKFCVIGDLVWTGSWNPAQEMSIPNNVVVIQSKTLATAYSLELAELANGKFHGGEKYPGLVRLNGNLAEAYFCPEDECAQQVLRILGTAKKSIHFMTFSFTDDLIGDLLLEKNKTIEVKGIFDPRKNDASEYEKLAKLSKIVKNHHKVFIVDGKTVITGSYNPSRNGNERNDENLVVIRDKNVADLFEKEFERLFNE